MASIRTYEGTIYLCTACGQPCHEDEDDADGMGTVLMHFDEQWDGIYCHMRPMAAGSIAVEWDEVSLANLKEQYPDTYPRS
jgi:hypothetical protein